tara:strand:+ start:347 stop:556 length:210 start_codon:yes stop_codon:yes gene_type:complete
VKEILEEYFLILHLLSLETRRRLHRIRRFLPLIQILGRTLFLIHLLLRRLIVQKMQNHYFHVDPFLDFD